MPSMRGVFGAYAMERGTSTRRDGWRSGLREAVAEARRRISLHDGQVCRIESMDFDVLQRVLEAFERLGVRYAIFGAVALNFHGLSRFTEDLHLFIAPEEENIERLRAALRSVFDDVEIDRITADDLLGDYPAVQYIPPAGGFHIDLLTRLGEAFAFGDLEVERLPFGDITVSVVSPKTLYRMKRNTVRLKDRADAELLKQRFRIEEE